MNTKFNKIIHIDNVRLGKDKKSVIILDQTELPGKTIYLSLSTPKKMYEAIKSLRIRGAPAIGIFGGYCIYVLARQFETTDYEKFARQFHEQKEYLKSSRPTAVNLGWALDRMEGVVTSNKSRTVGEILNLLDKECHDIHKEDITMCYSISQYGLSLIKDGDGILTHCNAGPLATSRYGTALGPLFLGRKKGMTFHVFADETRPLMQGARLTTYELIKSGIDVTLICDNMASAVMKNGWIDACLVGCDRIASNGDTANKIGTSSVAILAKYYNIPFYILGPTSSIDLNCPDGEHIPIELRDPEEIKEKWFLRPMTLPEVKCYNPAFDITDHSLISGIVTEKGICRPPFQASLAALFKN